MRMRGHGSASGRSRSNTIPIVESFFLVFSVRRIETVATHCLYESSGRTKHEERDGLKAKSYNNYVKDDEYHVEQYQEVEQEQ